MEEKHMLLIEGNIASGKSTLGQLLADKGYGFIPEPVGVWQQDFDENLLDLFYSDMKRWAFTFQLAAFATRAKTWSEVLALDDHSTVFLERSIFCDRYVFAQHAYNSGLMSKTEWQIYSRMWDWLQGQYCIQPDKIIYLRTPAEICHKRIAQRGRGEESSVLPRYLQALQRLHDSWLLGRRFTTVIDGTTEPDKIVGIILKTL